MKKIILFLFIPLLIFAQSFKNNNYIDIPTAKLNNGIFFNADGSYHLNSDNPNSLDPNLGLQYSEQDYEINLTWYSDVYFSLGGSYRILEEKNNIPSIILGVDNISYTTEISPLGSDTNTFTDERYNPRPPEVMSVYAIMTKQLSENFELSLGLGRGRFIGYGPRSHYFNFDNFFDEKHENFVIGAFGGFRINFPAGAGMILEYDGRDANIGLEFKNERLRGLLSLDKMEHIIFGDENSINSTRLKIGLSFKIGEKVSKKNLTLTFMEKESMEPVDVDFSISRDNEIVERNSTEDGIFSLELPDGDYTIYASSENFKGKKTSISLDRDRELNIIMEKKRRKEKYGELTMLSYDLESGEPLRVTGLLDDGEFTTGKLGKLTVKLKPGKHTIKVDKEGYRTYRRTVEVTTGERDTVDLSMVKGDFKIILPELHFETGSAELSDNSKELLRETSKTIKKIFKSNPELVIEIQGHTDAVGTSDYNMRLSQRRAESVKEFLVNRTDCPSESLVTRGYGENKPIDSNMTEKGRRRNRRVTFKVLK